MLLDIANIQSHKWSIMVRMISAYSLEKWLFIGGVGEVYSMWSDTAVHKVAEVY